jgi:hypothetical protein
MGDSGKDETDEEIQLIKRSFALLDGVQLKF